jgi:hypothetical protein
VTGERAAQVVGPVEGENPPAGIPTVDLVALGYVAEEFHLGGITRAYDLAGGTDYTEDGRWTAVAVAEAPFLTRILVVRPRDPKAFNGTVVLNWQNVSAGYEMGSLVEGDEPLNGYAWVGVSAQEVGIFGSFRGRTRGTFGGGRPLRERDPERYAALRHPGDRGSFDIFTKAARAVGPTRDGDVDPLGGLDVQRVIATGASQSAIRLASYCNAVHPLERAIDGFLLVVWEGRAPRLTSGGEDYHYVRSTLRDDLGTPTVIVNSEFEALATAGLDLADHDTLRVWEVTGTPHGNWPGVTEPDERGVIPNPLSYRPVQQAALRALHRWLADGTPVPHQPRIETVTEPRQAVVRQPHGNALGGIRVPEVAVPTHEYHGMSRDTRYLPLFGGAQRFTDDELRALYPSRAAFVEQWHAAVDHLVGTGALRPEDAEATKAGATEEAAGLPVD